MTYLSPFLHQLSARPSVAFAGQVIEANNGLIESLGPPCSVGECCEIVTASGERHAAEVIGFRERRVLTMPLRGSAGIRYGDRITSTGLPAQIAVGRAMLGRVFDGAGSVIDSGAIPVCTHSAPLDASPPTPLTRSPVEQPLATGVRAIDAMMTTGRGQRIGIFGGSGVGKSTLIGMMTRNSEADIVIIGLVGERGREVGEFLTHSLGEEGRRRSVVIASTSDVTPLMRMRAALAATAAAEHFAAQGKHVLLILDSLTRFAMAAREVGLAAGEPPASKGYPPSVFARMARLLERAGSFSRGSITAFYTVLMEGDDEQDPIVDSARSILDGHILLSRDLTSEGIYPPIDVLRSLSRLMPALVTPEHQARARKARKLLASYQRSEDLLRVGAYKPGSDTELDAAIRLRPRLQQIFRQNAEDCISFDSRLESFAFLDEIPG